MIEGTPKWASETDASLWDFSSLTVRGFSVQVREWVSILALPAHLQQQTVPIGADEMLHLLELLAVRARAIPAIQNQHSR